MTGCAAAGKKYFYPFLFALYPVFFLYRHNIREVPPARVFPALAVALAIAFGFWLPARLAARSAGKRALLLFMSLALFHSYGAFYDHSAAWLPADPPLLAYALAFILPGGIWFFLSRAVLRSPGDLAFINRCLQLAIFFLLLWNLAGILLHHGRSLAASGPEQHEKKAAAPQAAREHLQGPDIYCFVLDEFASLESARTLFGHDHSPFAETLRRQGFFVAQNSRSRFHATELAIADILNLGEFDVKKDPYPLIRRNAVAFFLKQRGYRIIEFPLEPVMFMEAADQRHHYPLLRASIFFDDFYRILFERSLLRFLPDRWRRQKSDLSRYYRERVLSVFEKMPAVVESPGPKFVFAHIFCPHEPFVFDELGGTPPGTGFWDHANPQNYLGQYKFISLKMKEALAMILAGSATPPVIVIQSDHGYRGPLRPGRQKSRVTQAEKFKVFNALYLPGRDQAPIPLSLSPRNNFRLVFSRFFGAELPLFEDR